MRSRIIVTNRTPTLLLVEIITCSLLLGTAWAQDVATGDRSIVPENTRIELLFDRGFFTEGPAVAPDGTVYFSDITFTASSGMQAGHIWRYDPSSGETVIFRSPSGMANGIIFDLAELS